MRLRRRARIDTIQNEIRAQGRSWARWIYLGLLALFGIWAFNLLVGDLIYFRAEGLVLRDRIVLATQYPAAINQLEVQEGSEVMRGQLVARVRSLSVEESLAKLYSSLVDGLNRTTQLKVRQRVIEATAPLSDQRYNEARAARIATEALRDQQLLTVGRRAEIVKTEIESAQARTEAEVERATISENLPELDNAVQATKQALGRLQDTYADGVMQSPADGVVGYLRVAKGSVVAPSDALMEIFTGQPYVLAYVREGALYDLQVDDPISIWMGFKRYFGRIERIYSVAGQLPKEFQNTFEPVDRARIVRIAFEPVGDYPPLFSKAKLSAAGWPPAWVKRLTQSLHEAVLSALAPTESKATGSER